MEEAAPVSSIFEFESPKFSRNLIRIEMERRASRKFKLGFFFFFLCVFVNFKKREKRKREETKELRFF